MEPEFDYTFFYGNHNANHQSWVGIFVPKGIRSAVKGWSL
jgi:hypothetical protein